jgi:hypothetical protein
MLNVGTTDLQAGKILWQPILRMGIEPGSGTSSVSVVIPDTLCGGDQCNIGSPYLALALFLRVQTSADGSLNTQ